MWTPALKPDKGSPDDLAQGDESVSDYLGLIFAVFMVCVMVGSSIYKIAAAQPKMTYVIPLYLHAAAFCSMFGVTVFLENKSIVYFCFLVFECSVGVFWPAYGVIKSDKIPEDIRSAGTYATISLYRSYLSQCSTVHWKALIFFYHIH